jgi:hypothetical protein
MMSQENVVEELVAMGMVKSQQVCCFPILQEADGESFCKTQMARR